MAALRKRVFETPEDADEDIAKKVRQEFFSAIMFAVSAQDLPAKAKKKEKRRANEWLQKSELKSLRELLDLPITAARCHMNPRDFRGHRPTSSARKGN